MRESILNVMGREEVIEKHTSRLDDIAVSFIGQIAAIEMWTMFIGAIGTDRYVFTKAALPTLFIALAVNAMYRYVNNTQENVSKGKLARQYKAYNLIQTVVGITHFLYTFVHLNNLFNTMM